AGPHGVKRTPCGRVFRGHGGVLCPSHGWAAADRHIAYPLLIACLPDDFTTATLVGRVWLPAVDGPALVAVAGDGLHDLSSVAPTCSQLLELEDVVTAAPAAPPRRPRRA